MTIPACSAAGLAPGRAAAPATSGPSVRWRRAGPRIGSGRSAWWVEGPLVVETLHCLGCGAALPSGIGLRRCAQCLDDASLSATSPLSPGEPAVLPVQSPQTVSADYAAFRRAVLEFDLLDAERFDRLAVEAAHDASRLAASLVRANHLTDYQAAALLQGKARGLLVGPYLVLSKCGQGGMGVIFKARHRPTRQVVALKILPPSFAKDPTLVQRFEREVAAAARLDHPNIVRIVDASQDRGVHFLAMDFIDGRDLRSTVLSGGPLPIDQAVSCLIQTARGLEAAHARGIVHRDVKPANLMLDTTGIVRVLDLGLARLVEASDVLGPAGAESLTQSGSYMGTVDYCAPEQADDAKTVDYRADIYSLGCTLYFLLAGKPPFEGDSLVKKLMAHQNRPAPSLHSARPDVPAALEIAYQAMMSKNPADRPQSMTAVIWLLESARQSDTGRPGEKKGLITFVDGKPVPAAPGVGAPAQGVATPSPVPVPVRPGDGRPFNPRAGVYAVVGVDPNDDTSPTSLPAPRPLDYPEPEPEPEPAWPAAGLRSMIVLVVLGVILAALFQLLRARGDSPMRRLDSKSLPARAPRLNQPATPPAVEPQGLRLVPGSRDAMPPANTPEPTGSAVISP